MPVAKAERSREFLARIRQTLGEKRVMHSVFVAEYFSSFAERAGLDHDEAVAAGLLHDLARSMNGEELLAQARARRIPLGEAQLLKPLLLHGPVAAENCREEFGVSDDVHEAVYWHTTGRPGMGRLAQGLCVADFSEPSRDYPEAAQARDILRKSGFGPAVLYVFEKKVEFGRSKEVTDPNTAATLFWLREHPPA